MNSIVATAIGAAVGGVTGDAYGALSGSLLAWLLLRSQRQQQQITALERALEQREAGSAVLLPEEADVAAPATLATPPSAATPSTTTAPSPASPSPALGAPPAETTRPAPSPLVPPAAASAAAATAAPARPNLFARLARWFFGGNTIVKAGIGILFIGLAFLAKYASENVRLPVELRLASIAAVALLLLAIGWRLRHRRAGYAQVLQGGAVAVLFLTLFVAFRFYGLLPAGPVFALMVVVAALAAALAVLQDARALAVIGALGGFATPLLVSTGSADHVALFSYYLVLDLGIAAVAWHKTWRLLNGVGFVGTFLVGSGWGVLEYRPEHYATSQGFLIAFFLVFVAILLMPARIAQRGGDGAATDTTTATPNADAWVSGSLLFGLPTVVFALQYGLVRDTAYGAALSALLLAAFYVLLAVSMRSRPRLGLTFDASLAIGSVFLTLVIPFALDARSTAGAWSLEGAGLVWLGFRQSRRLPRGFGYALLLLAGASMLVGHERFGAPAGVVNAYLINGLMAAGAALAAAWFVHRRHRVVDAVDAVDAVSASAAPSTRERIAEPLLIGWAVLWLLSAATVEIDAFVAWRHRPAAWLAVVSGIALVCTLLSHWLRWRNVGWPAVAHAPLLGVAVASAAGLQSSGPLPAGPLQDGGVWAWPLALGVHALVLWRLAAGWPAGVRTAVHALGALVLAALGALQGRAITAAWGDAASAWAWLGWLVAPAALLLWLPRPAALRTWPVRAEPAAYRQVAAGVLSVGLLGWSVLANIASDGSARPLPHLPLLNPLDLGIGIALLAAGLWLRSVAGAAMPAPQPQSPLRSPLLAPVLLGGAGFVWLNAILVRAFHHLGGVPFEFDAWSGSLAVQTGVTLLWTTTALVLMWWSARRAVRLPWMAGAALLAAVVLKLLLVDLSGSGTVTRIVSFIGVGVLMLVIGYVAPLPGRREADHATA